MPQPPAPLLDISGVSSQKNEQHIARFLLQLTPEEHDTFYQVIKRLPPGSQLKATLETVRVHQYWSPLHVRTATGASFEENAEHFKTLFFDAVRCRTLDSDTIASTLSGGLDSSSITCTLNEIFKGPPQRRLHTYSAIFPSLPKPLLARIDERKYMDLVRQQCHPISHDIHADQLNPFASLANDVAHVGQPFFGPNMYIHDAMYKAAADNNSFVFFDGTDGDSVLSYGFEIFPALLCCGKLSTLWSEIQALKNTSASRQSCGRLLASYAIKPLLKSFQNYWQRTHLSSLPGFQEQLRRLQPDFCRRNHIRDLIRLHLQRTDLPNVNASKHHKASLALPYLAHILEIQAFYSAQHQIHLRLPFLDLRLVEFCLSLPPEHKFQRGWSRAVQRAGMKGHTPQRILQRLDKGDLGPNFLQHAQEQGQNLIQKIIEPASKPLTEFLRIDEALRPYQQKNNLQNCAINHFLFLYILANFSSWLNLQKKSP